MTDKKKKLTFFDFVDTISNSKTNLMDEDKENESAYNFYMVNRALSYFPDTVFYANVMNQHYSLPPKVQYDYLLGSIKRRKRFAKWAKVPNNESLKVIEEYYNYSTSKALEVFRLFSEETINTLKERLNHGK